MTSRLAAMPVLLAAALAVGCGSAGVLATDVAYRWGPGGAPPEPEGQGWIQLAQAPISLTPPAPGVDLWVRVRPPRAATPGPVAWVSWNGLEDQLRQGSRLLESDAITRSLVELPDRDEPVLVRYGTDGGPIALAPYYYVGSSRALAAELLRAATLQAAVACILVFGGVLTLLLGLRRRRRETRHLGAFAALLGCMVLAEARPLSIALVSSEALWMWCMELATLLYPAPFAAFVRHAFAGGEDRVLRFMERTSIATAGLGALLHVLDVIPISVIREVSYVLVLIVIGRTLALLVARARGGDADARTFLAGFTALVVVSSPHVLDGMGLGHVLAHVVPPWSLRTTHLGALGFVLMLGVLLERRMHAQAAAVTAAHAELTRRVDDLEAHRAQIERLNHDLCEQVAMRSRELVRSAAAPLMQVGELVHGNVIEGRYRVLRELGRGGMGAVYEVERIRDGERFAAKVMTGASGRLDLARFAREAEIAARVSHPALVRVVDVGNADGLPFLVMELVRGRSLEQERARFGDPAFAYAILEDVARGLAALHREAVVHRDLKPANVIVTDGPDRKTVTARITDFGIARADLPVDPSASTVGHEAHITSTGVVMGTPYYMAPELARGTRGARPSSDVFSFGVLAYELLTGELPFRVPAVLAALVGEPVAAEPLALRGAPDTPLTRRLDDCLAFDPERRPTAEELVQALCARRA